MWESSHPHQDPSFNRLPALPDSYLSLPASNAVVDAPERPPTADYWRLFRKYILLVLLLTVIGGTAGFFSVAFFSPVYQAQALLEVTSTGPVIFKNAVGGGDDASQVNVQTQIQLLKTSSFLRRVMERLQLETVPPPPVQNDVFSQLRHRLRTSTQDPLALMKEGLTMALKTFSARPVTGTRIIEIECDSTSPDIAANFVNTLASEYIEQNAQGHAQTSQQASQWLSGQLEETRNKMQEAQQRLQEFVKEQGSLFVLQDHTLDNSKLQELQGQLSGIQADRIAKQARYELVAKSAPEALPDVLDDVTLRNYQIRIADLRREVVALKATLTPDNPKVSKLEVQVTELQTTLNKEVSSVLQRIKNDYDASLRREKLLSAEYAKQAGQVSSQASKSAQYSGLRREVEMAQQTYSAMLLQANESNIAGSVQQSGIRQVDSATPPAEPYKPKPALNIGFGTMAGLCLSIGVAFLWEKMDRSVRSPGHSRTLLNVPELGVIPSIASQTPRTGWRLLPGRDNKDATDSMRPELHFQKSSQARSGEPISAQLADSFRVTMASLMLGNASGRRPQVILVTSPSPGEGKTTIVGNLGTALAETGRSVLVVDGDFRRPKLHKLFELENNWGLSDILAEGVELPEKLGLETTVPGLMVLPNGIRPESVSKLLYSSQMRRFFQAVRERFDVVLIDAPPILEVADARLLGEFADGALLVLRSGITDRADALQAYQQLFEDRTTLLGTVLNDFKPSRKSRQFYEYYSLQQND
jgi:succinoglycan biosynthesis transport protein ExoP